MGQSCRTVLGGNLDFLNDKKLKNFALITEPAQKCKTMLSFITLTVNGIRWETMSKANKMVVLISFVGYKTYLSQCQIKFGFFLTFAETCHKFFWQPSIWSLSFVTSSYLKAYLIVFVTFHWEICARLFLWSSSIKWWQCVSLHTFYIFVQVSGRLVFD